MRKQKEIFGESLDARVLYSGAASADFLFVAPVSDGEPVFDDLNSEHFHPTDKSPSVIEAKEQIDGQNVMVTLSSLANLTDEEVAFLESIAVERGANRSETLESF